jgi:hypothetical protein
MVPRMNYFGTFSLRFSGAADARRAQTASSIYKGARHRSQEEKLFSGRDSRNILHRAARASGKI